MQAWAKRGLQTALVTGGLLMLGTGIASADEDVNPDKPASPLDVKIHVPVHVDNNALGTPLGQKNIPGLNRDVEVAPGDVVGRVPVANQAAPAALAKASAAAAPVLDQARPVTDRASEQTTPLTGKVTDQTGPLAEKVSGATGKAGLPGVPHPQTPNLFPEVHGMLCGNSVDGDLVVPVDLSGNAIALLGNAHVENDSYQAYATDESVMTDGQHGLIAGNAVDLDWALPVQITGNALAAGGKASSESYAEQETSNTSNVTTNGENGALSGNVGAIHGATPVQVTGNAIAGLGRSFTRSEAESSAEAGGWVLTSGEEGLGSGNVAGVPVATPLMLNGNGIAGLGRADAEGMGTANATAGAERPGLYNVPTYLETNGSPALASGNVLQPAISGPALLCGNAAAAAGVAEAECESVSQTVAGGGNRTNGAGSVASGSILHPVVALPVEGFGNAGAVLGCVEAAADNEVNTSAGGDSYTRGHDSVLSGTTVTGGPVGPVDVFSNAIAAVGDAEATANNDSGFSGGGSTGTTGDDSAAGGSVVTAPVSVPVEGFGNTIAGVGGATATATETKGNESGGGGSAADDNGLAASNLVSTPVAGAVQLFGNGAGVLGFTDATATTDNDVAAGGDNKATGIGGIGSANIGHVPVTVPAQVFGTGASALASGHQAATSTNNLSAGGDTTSDGYGSALSGNVVNSPVGTAAQAFGESAAVLGPNDAVASSDTVTTTGGTTETDGTSSLGSGNVVSPQAMPIAQSFAAVASGVGGVNSSIANNENDNTAGGDIDTVGDHGFLSGNIADVPAAAVAQPFGDAVAAIGSQSVAVADNQSESEVGGNSTTTGEWGSLSGIDGTVPVGAHAPVYDVPVEVLAQAITEAGNVSTLDVGEGSQLNVPVSGSDASPTRMPSLMPMGGGRSMSRDVALPAPVPADDLTGSFTGVLDGFADGMGALPGLPAVSPLSGTVAEQPRVLPAPVTPVSAARSADPFAPVSGDLFGGDVLGGDLFGDLPVSGDLFGDLPVSTSLGEVPLGGLSGAPIQGLGGVPDVTAPLPANGGRSAAPAAVPGLDGVDITRLVPMVPAFGDATAVPVVQSPSLNGLPVQAPGVSGSRAVDQGSLTDTQAALANLFTMNPIG